MDIAFVLGITVLFGATWWLIWAIARMAGIE
jgi:hypothetical protein